MRSSLFFFPARILCLLCLFFSNKPIRTGERPVVEISFFTIHCDSLFSLFSLNKMAAKTMASEATHTVEDYLSKTAWPAVKKGSRELVAEMSSEMIKQTQNTIEKIFFAGSGIALVAAGGQIIRKTIVDPQWITGPKKNRRILLAIGAGMILGGIGAILFCDRLANQLTPTAG